MKWFASFGLDTANQCLWQEGERMALPPKPFAVLRYLVENPGRLITHDELLEALWPDTYVQPQILRTYVLELRKILKDDARQPRFIQSLPKRGYRFLAEIVENETASRGPVAHAETQGIVGREEELAFLKTCLQRAKDGDRQVVFVAGDSGIGKTAIVDTFCGEIDSSASVMVARGQCVQGVAQKEDYYPIMEALHDLCASPHGDRARKMLSGRAPNWLALPENESAIRSATRAPGELCAALQELAAEKLLILVLEDLHWADESSLDLLSALARRRGHCRLLILGTFNPQHARAEHSLAHLKQDLRMRHLCAEIALGPLARRDVHEMVFRALGEQAASEPLVDFVHRYAQGNPLFVLATLDHLIAQQFLVRVGSGASAHWEQRILLGAMEAGVPEQLAQMIELEIDRLNPRDRRLLEAGSLLPVAFPAWAVAAALNEDAVDTEEACDELARRLYFVRRAGNEELPDGTRSAFYVFAHGLYREVLYHRQALARRAQWHGRIAKRLEEMFTGRETDVAQELAMHYEAAGNGSRAIACLRGAAQLAMRRHSHRAAEEFLRNALRVVASLPLREQDVLESELQEELEIALRSNIHRAEIKAEELGKV